MRAVSYNFFNPCGNFTLTHRGFTGHEHYPYFKIINMNGRLYDPVIGRFFSPDKYVQDPYATQDFNRYSYAKNNPLKYVDPTGQWYDSELREVEIRVDRYDYDSFGNFRGMDNDMLNNVLNDYNRGGDPVKNPDKFRRQFQNALMNTGMYLPPNKSNTPNTNGRENESNILPDPFDKNGIIGRDDDYLPNISSRRGTGWGDRTAGFAGNAFGGLGVGMKQMGGTFRFTNGTYNSNRLSIRHYASNWRGGSRAGITTFSMPKWGGGIARGTIVTSISFGTVDIIQGIVSIPKPPTK